MTWTITQEIEPEPALREAILAVLLKHNTEAAGDGDWQALAITVRDEAGAVVGGLWGYTLYGFLFVELLAMGEARGGGVGRQVMALAEAEAKQRGCVGMWLDTFTFQAPWFYPKLGFTELARIQGYPPGHDRLFLVKRFDQAEPPAG
jgi:GNAT superfamily N-acetyltransferase